MTPEDRLVELRRECIRIAAGLVRLPGEIQRGTELIDREAVVVLALQLRDASDKAMK